uniref:Uncharacterized protein n=1 Tax=Cacopsylla melanoneura TaxID=428564 RepID=A0A8D9BDW1_9HEMI
MCLYYGLICLSYPFKVSTRRSFFPRSWNLTFTILSYIFSFCFVERFILYRTHKLPRSTSYIIWVDGNYVNKHRGTAWWVVGGGGREQFRNFLDEFYFPS